MQNKIDVKYQKKIKLKKLCIRFYCSRCYTCSGFGVLTKKNKLFINMHSKLLNIIESGS